jgi:syntaxin 16
MSIEEITQLEQSAAFARERDEKMKTISKSITEVAQIFKELAVLVIDQGTVLDRCANILCSVQM